MKYFYSFFGIILQFYFKIFLTEAAQYECSYRRTAHHATAPNVLIGTRGTMSEYVNK